MPNDGRDPTPVAGKGIYQVRFGVVDAHACNALDPTAQRLYKDRSIRSKTRLFRADVSIAVLSHIKIFRLEQLEIRETPKLVGDATEDIVLMHRGVRGDNAVEFGKNDQAVRRQQGIWKSRIRIAAGANHLAQIVNLHQATAGTHMPFSSAVMRVLKCGEHVPVR